MPDLLQPVSLTMKSEVSIASDSFSSSVSQSLWIKSKLLNMADKPSMICIALPSPASPLHSGSSQTLRLEFHLEAMLSFPHYESFKSQLTYQSPQEALAHLD